MSESESSARYRLSMSVGHHDGIRSFIALDQVTGQPALAHVVEPGGAYSRLQIEGMLAQLMPADAAKVLEATMTDRGWSVITVLDEGMSAFVPWLLARQPGGAPPVAGDRAGQAASSDVRTPGAFTMMFGAGAPPITPAGAAPDTMGAAPATPLPAVRPPAAPVPTVPDPSAGVRPGAFTELFLSAAPPAAMHLPPPPPPRPSVAPLELPPLSMPSVPDRVGAPSPAIEAEGLPGMPRPTPEVRTSPVGAMPAISPVPVTGPVAAARPADAGPARISATPPPLAAAVPPVLAPPLFGLPDAAAPKSAQRAQPESEYRLIANAGAIAPVPPVPSAATARPSETSRRRYGLPVLIGINAVIVFSVLLILYFVLRRPDGGSAEAAPSGAAGARPTADTIVADTSAPRPPAP